MNEDFIETMPVITNNDGSGILFHSYDKVYPYTTEVISGYMPNCTGATVLTVAGSGDHFLNAVLMGAKRVDTFDINKLALLYQKLKRAAVLALSKDEFYDFMTRDARKYFPRVAAYLDDNSIEFWSDYLKYFVYGTGIQGTPMFFPRCHGSDYLTMNNYMQQGNYDLLREKLASSTLSDEFHMDIDKLFIGNKYDKIFLSNIINYKPLKDDFAETIGRLIDYNLNTGGEIYYGYFYHNHQDDIDFYLDCFPSTEIIPVDSTTFKGEKDHVLVYKKRSH